MIICPKCKRQCDADSEQAVSVEWYQECVTCRFVKGDGTEAELKDVAAEAKNRRERPDVQETVEIPAPASDKKKDCLRCGKEMHFLVGWFNEDETVMNLAHNVYHCECGVMCRESVGDLKGETWLTPGLLEPMKIINPASEPVDLLK